MVMPESSLEFWKAVPSTSDALFSIKLPYKPPRHPLAAFFWRKRVWFETTFGIEGTEPVEKVLLTVMYLLPFALIAYVVRLWVWPFIWGYVSLISLILPISLVIKRRAVEYISNYQPQVEASAHRAIVYATRNSSVEL